MQIRDYDPRQGDFLQGDICFFPIPECLKLSADAVEIALESDPDIVVRNARLIAEDEAHGQPRRLLEASVNGQPIRILEVLNGSVEPDGRRRKFHLGAMAGNTPHTCVAASYGRNPDKYREADRT